MPPDNGGYMVAGYVVTTLILLLYVLTLWRRVGAEMKDEQTVSTSTGTSTSSAS